jgi:hypothetical protein
MRSRIFFTAILLSLATQADETWRPTSSETTWIWITMLNSDPATEALAKLREFGVSEEGAKRLLKHI